MRKKFTLMLALVFIFTLFAACKTSDSENTVKGFINTYYTVNKADYKYYLKMLKGSSISNLAEYDKSYESHTGKYKQYLSKNSYNAFYANRMSYYQIRIAYEGGYYVKVNNIKIKRIEKDKTDHTIAYDYTYQVKQIDVKTKKTKVITLDGGLTVKKENGKWKIINLITP